MMFPNRSPLFFLSPSSVQRNRVGNHFEFRISITEFKFFALLAYPNSSSAALSMATFTSQLFDTPTW